MLALALLFFFCRLRSRPELHKASSSLATGRVGLIDLWAPRESSRLWILARLASRFRNMQLQKTSSNKNCRMREKKTSPKPNRTQDMGTKPGCPQWRTTVRPNSTTSFPTRPLENRKSLRPWAWGGPLHRRDSCRDEISTFRMGGPSKVLGCLCKHLPWQPTACLAKCG